MAGCLLLVLAQPFLLFSNPTALRILPDYYVPGEPVKVELTIDPGQDALAWVVEDTPPAGWVVSRIDKDGVMDKFNQKVKWGLFLDNKSREVSYIVIPPQNENTTIIFSGLVSVNGHSFNLQGETTLGWGLKLILNHFLGIPGGKQLDPNNDDRCDIGDILYLLR